MYNLAEIAFRSVTFTWNIFMYRVYLNKYGENYFILLCYVVYAELIMLSI